MPSVKAFSIFGEIGVPGTGRAIGKLRAFGLAGDRAAKAMGFLNKSTALAAAGAVALGAAVAVVGVKSLSAFGEFDEAMTTSLAIMGDVSEAMEKDMARAARKMALVTSFSATQAAKAYFFLASAGLNAAQSLAAMPTVARFAQAGNFDLALATDLLTDAQSALGLTIRDNTVKNMENMIRVSDVLVKANTLANATVQQFSEALTNRAGPALRLVNKDIEEGAAVLAVMADQGVKGAEAGTRLDIVFRELQRRALENREEFERFGIEVFDTAGEMRNMADILVDFEREMEGVSAATKRATIMQLGFSARSVASLLMLIGFSKELRKYEEGMREAGDITREVATKQLDTLRKEVGLLGSAFAELGIQIGEGLAPPVRKGVRALTALVNELGDVEGRAKDAVREVQALDTVRLTINERIESRRAAASRTSVAASVAGMIGARVDPDEAARVAEQEKRAREREEADAEAQLLTLGDLQHQRELELITRQVLIDAIKETLDTARITLDERRALELQAFDLQKEIDKEATDLITKRNTLIMSNIDAERAAFIASARERRANIQAARSFELLTGRLTLEERIAQINQELQVLQLGQAERIRLQTERFQLARRLTSQAITEAQRIAQVNEEAAIQVLAAWRRELAKLGLLFPALTDKIDDAMREVAEDSDVKGIFEGMGGDVVDGLIRGITGGEDRLKRFILSFLQRGLIRVFTMQLGIFSPSKVFEGYGESIVDGLIRGIESRQSRLNNVMANLIATPQLAAQGGLTGLSFLPALPALPTPTIPLPSDIARLAEWQEIYRETKRVAEGQGNI